MLVLEGRGDGRERHSSNTARRSCGIILCRQVIWIGSREVRGLLGQTLFLRFTPAAAFVRTRLNGILGLRIGRQGTLVVCVYGGMGGVVG